MFITFIGANIELEHQSIFYLAVESSRIIPRKSFGRSRAILTENVQNYYPESIINLLNSK